MNVEALIPLANALESLGTEFYIGGSIASSFHGIGRSTVDIDVVADLHQEHVSRLAAMLEADFYADAQMMREAIRSRSSFNVIHKPTSYKIDVFVIGRRPFDREARNRLVRGRLPGDETRAYPLASAEDTVLNKLEWYRMGGEVSDRQWNDILGVMKVQDSMLDRAYLQRWAAELGVSDLLERAMKEAGL